MNIILNNSSMVPIYEQLIAQIKNAIIEKQITESQMLPSVRSLAAQLKISALTVKKAYDKLEEEGFVTTVHGKGTYVSRVNTNIQDEIRRLHIENQFDDAIVKAKSYGMDKKEIIELINILLGEEDD